MKVGFGNLEAVGGFGHYLQSATGVACCLVFRHEDAVRLVGAATYASAQLMQLRQPEALGIFDYHYRGVGHVDAHFDYRGGYQNACLAGGKALHLLVFVGGLHLAVHETNAVVAERVDYVLIAFFEAF